MVNIRLFQIIKQLTILELTQKIMKNKISQSPFFHKMSQSPFFHQKKLSKFVMRTFILCFSTSVFCFSTITFSATDTGISVNENKVGKTNEVLSITRNDFSSNYKKDTPGHVSIIQQHQITGNVTDSNGAPLPGASILEKGTSNGVQTDFDGNFTLTVANQNATLVISYMGFTTKEIPVNGQSAITIQLEESASALDEVVVVGFGTQKKINLTGAVTSVGSEVLESRPVSNVSQMLQGVMPGLNFQSSGMGGELNSGLSFNIRGAGSIGAGSSSSPLVLIDGMEADLNAVNPSDIESVSVLKDAAAASIYGSRAAFGVILITTKTGKSGMPRVQYNTGLRVTTPLGLPKMMDSYTFALYWNEAAGNGNEAAIFTPEILDRIQKFQIGEITETNFPNESGELYEKWDRTHANNDWFDVLYKDQGFAQEHNLSMSGGSDNINYYVSANYLDQDGLLKFSEDHFNRYGFTTKVNVKLNEYFKFNTSTRFIREDYEKATHQGGLFYHNIARRWPTTPVLEPNGEYHFQSEISQLKDGGRNVNQNDRVYFQGELVITPLEGWEIYINGNYNITNINNHEDILPAYAYRVDGTPFPVGVAGGAGGYSQVYEYNRKNDYFSSNIYSNYEFNLNDVHNFKILAGSNSELHKYRTIGASRTGIIDRDKPTINTSTEDSKATEGQYQHWSVAGYFARLNYNFKQKYLLELNLRYDGSSRFIDDKRWQLFPSVSAGWNIAKEDFWMWGETIQVFKPRVSYGELGNQNTSNWYPFYVSMPIGVNNGGWLINGERPNTAGAPGLVSSMLTWEKISNWNIGLDASLLRNKLSLSFEYFNRQTIDMVGPAPELPNILGTSVPQINNADMKSTGFELEVNWKDYIGDFNYSIRGVLSDSRQEITRYPNKTDNLDTWYEGRSMGEIWGYTTIGIAKTDAEMNAHLENTDQSQLGSNWQAGDIMFADLNGDGVVNGGSGRLGDSGDRKIIGNSTPRFRYGIDLSADYKSFDLRIFFQGIGKRDYMPGGPYFWGANGGMWQSAAFEDHLDYFRDENSPMVQAGVADVNLDSYFPRPYFNTGKNQQTQTKYVQDASYLRLKNVQVGYTIQSIAGAKIRVYISGENLFTFTKMTDIFDPETVGLGGWGDGKTYPYAKVYSAGLSINL